MNKLPGHVNRMIGIGPSATHGGSGEATIEEEALIAIVNLTEGINDLGNARRIANQALEQGNWSDDKTYEEAPKGEVEALVLSLNAVATNNCVDLKTIEKAAELITRQAAEIEALKAHRRKVLEENERLLKAFIRKTRLLDEAAKVLRPQLSKAARDLIAKLKEQNDANDT